jgi:hypothetical protein
MIITIKKGGAVKKMAKGGSVGQLLNVLMVLL